MYTQTYVKIVESTIHTFMSIMPSYKVIRECSTLKLSALHTWKIGIDCSILVSDLLGIVSNVGFYGSCSFFKPLSFWKYIVLLIIQLFMYWSYTRTNRMLLVIMACKSPRLTIVLDLLCLSIHSKSATCDSSNTAGLIWLQFGRLIEWWACTLFQTLN